MKYYTIGQFAKIVGKSIQTLRLWDAENKLKPHHVSDGGHRILFRTTSMSSNAAINKRKQKKNNRIL